MSTAGDFCSVPQSRSFGVMSILSGEEDILLDRRSVSNDDRPSHSYYRLTTMLAINTASVLEKTDEQLLPAVYKYVGCSFNNATPGVLQNLMTARRYYCVMSLPCPVS